MTRPAKTTAALVSLGAADSLSARMTAGPANQAAPASPSGSRATAQEGHVEFDPAPVIPLASQPPARLVVDSPLPESLASGRVVVRYRTENLRILPVFGPAALDVSPRIGHLHVTVDGGPWRWVDSSGEPLIINKLPPGPHKILVELVDPTHKVIDATTIYFVIP